MKKQQSQHQSQGFAILSLTVILLMITVSISLPSALSSYKRIHRTNLDTLYQQSKIKAAMQLDLYFLILYESPLLLNIADNCPINFQTEKMQLSEIINDKYQLDGFHLCQLSASQFDIAVRVDHGFGIESVTARRQLKFLDNKLNWVADSFVDF